MIIIVLKFITYPTIHGEDDNAAFYLETQSMNCSSVENAGKMNRIHCAARRSTKEDMLCSGFVLSQTGCEFCIVCPQAMTITPYNAIRGVYTETYINFNQELQEGIP